MRNLVIVPAGDGSLHMEYASDRDFDLWILYWGSNDDVRQRYSGAADRVISLKGHKWELLRQAAALLMAERRRWEGGYVLYVDDDIRFPHGAADISAFFSAVRDLDADTAQPAIANENVSWPIGRALDGAFCHATNAVESMMPAYSSAIFFEVVLPGLYALPHIRMGWHFEFFVQRYAEFRFQRPLRTFVVDAVPALHTRPPGSGTAPHELGANESFLLPGLAPMPVVTLAVFADRKSGRDFGFPMSLIDGAGMEQRLAALGWARRAAAMRIDAINPAAFVLSAAKRLFNAIFPRSR
jgi:hypothetical protein